MGREAVNPFNQASGLLCGQHAIGVALTVSALVAPATQV